MKGRRAERLAELGRLSLLCAVFLSSGCAARAASHSAETVSAQALLARGRDLARAGDYVGAEQFLVAALAAGSARDSVLPLLLRVCVDAGRLQRATEHARGALQQAPHDPQLWVLIASLLWAGGDPGSARMHLERALALPAAPPEAYYWLGRVLFDEGARESGRERLQQYLRAQPEGPFAARARWWLLQPDVLPADTVKHGRNLPAGGAS